MALVPVLFLAFMGAVLHHTRGQYSRTVAGYGALYFFTCFVMLTARKWRPLKPRLLAIALASTVAFFSLMVCRAPSLLYPVPGAAQRYFHWITTANFCFSLLLLVIVARRGDAESSPVQAARWLSIAALALWVAAMLLVPRISPRPFIDVWVNNEAAVAHFLHGRNPYSQVYEDIYKGGYGYKTAFSYFPGILFWLAPFQALFGDGRYGYVAANALTAVAFLALGRRLRIPEVSRWLVALVWLSFPVTCFIVEQAWVDPLLVCLTVLALWQVECRRWIVAGLLAGAALTIKQYGFLFTGAVLVWIWHLAGRRPALRAATAALAVVAGALLPFAIANWHAFYESTIDAQSSAPFRPDALTLTAFVYAQARITIPGWLRMLLPAAAALYSGWWLLRMPRARLSDMAAALALSYGVAFLFGKWAFCNFHYLLAAFILTFIASSAATPPAGPSDRLGAIKPADSTGGSSIATPPWV